ncbi:hypothetical protein MRB53_018698 [Persea americana]|uniref:Uncharacterized protein n=1 Tax=Persea americana TaxID=3435 RepID=A0ACC2M8Q7_PERAE|nr:hypothetical protein MRB53_018698 [Persea americana]
MSDGEEANVARCDHLHQALRDCHRRFSHRYEREISCRHLNRALANCLVSVACPSEFDAVRSLCSSSGTALKRSQENGWVLRIRIALSDDRCLSIIVGSFWKYH